MAVGHAHGGDGGVHVVDARFRRFQCGGGGHAGGGVALHVHRYFQFFLQLANQVVGHVRLQQTGHFLDGDGISAHGLDFFRQIHPHVDGVHRAGGVGDGALGVLASLAHGFDGSVQVAWVVHGIEDTEHVHAVFGGTIDKPLYHIIRVMAVAQQVLAAQQHLLRGVGHGLLELADAVPGVFAQVTDTGIKGSAAPGFQ